MSAPNPSYPQAFEHAAKRSDPYQGRLAIIFKSVGDVALSVQHSSYLMTYDFLSRVLVCTQTTGSSQGGVAMTTTPFSQLDPEVLQAMQQKLTELGGKPPPLPETNPAAAQPPKASPIRPAV